MIRYAQTSRMRQTPPRPTKQQLSQEGPCHAYTSPPPDRNVIPADPVDGSNIHRGEYIKPAARDLRQIVKRGFTRSMHNRCVCQHIVRAEGDIPSAVSGAEEKKNDRQRKETARNSWRLDGRHMWGPFGQLFSQPPTIIREHHSRNHWGE